MSRAAHKILSFVPWRIDSSRTPYRYRADACGECAGCGRCSLACFEFHAGSKPELDKSWGDLNKTFYNALDPNRKITGKLLWQAPAIGRPHVPEHLPGPIEKAFLDAEKAFSQGIWSLAAGGYRKAVDRGITPLIEDTAKGKMLGPKIGMLERTNLLPPAMLDWIRIVKDDGNFALHDDELDFDTKEEVEPAREFAFTLLTYLYTLPEKVRIARGQMPEA
jgi:hypothetical protein